MSTVMERLREMPTKTQRRLYLMDRGWRHVGLDWYAPGSSTPLTLAAATREQIKAEQ